MGLLKTCRCRGTAILAVGMAAILAAQSAEGGKMPLTPPAGSLCSVVDAFLITGDSVFAEGYRITGVATKGCDC